MLSDDTSRNLGRIRQVSQQGKKVQGLFRLMTHSPDLWLEAYAKIYANKGAVTKGIDGNTLDGMSEERVFNLITLLKENRYFPAPVRRTHIPKANGRTRPLGIPRGDDKLVQEVTRRLLETIYEQKFETTSHGFRPNRSCHTALTSIKETWAGVTWFVDMDIQGYFDNISHEKLIEMLRQTVDDCKFLTLIKRMLKAGYLEKWTYHRTYSGTPQGGIISPILANIYLHELDVFMKRYSEAFEAGGRVVNPAYQALNGKIHYRRQKINRLKHINPEEVKRLRQEIVGLDKARKRLPSKQPDALYKRLRYIRYADDFLIGLIGQKADAQEAEDTVRTYLKQALFLDIAEAKSGIHHGSQGTQFLGYHIRTRTNQRERKRCYTQKVTGRRIYSKQRTMTKAIHLGIPHGKVQKFCREHGYVKQGKVMHRVGLQQCSDWEIALQYNAELRGLANFYALTEKRLLRFAESYALRSMFKTLAAKHRTTSRQIRNAMKQESEHRVVYERNGERKTLTVFKLKHRPPYKVQPVDEKPPSGSYEGSTELLKRMDARKCEYCGKEKGYFEVHHVRKLKDIKDDKAPWQSLMIERRRKTLILCVECHQLLHAGNLPSWRMSQCP